VKVYRRTFQWCSGEAKEGDQALLSPRSTPPVADWLDLPAFGRAVDVGHDPARPGAVSARRAPEFQFLAARLARCPLELPLSPARMRCRAELLLLKRDAGGRSIPQGHHGAAATTPMMNRATVRYNAAQNAKSAESETQMRRIVGIKSDPPRNCSCRSIGRPVRRLSTRRIEAAHSRHG
jgi:hypothetical protein